MSGSCPDHLNALQQVQLTANNLTLAGFSISGLATYLQVPELDVVFDLGECPLSAVPIDHVFLTHAHGDHARCVPRHWQLRRMLGNARPAIYFLPEAIREAYARLIAAEARFEDVAEDRITYPTLVGMVADGAPVELPHRKDLRVRAFPVHHSVPSLGYTILAHKKKLRPELHGLPGAEIARLRRAGEDVSIEVLDPLITFIGDCDGPSLLAQRHIWSSPILVIEATFLDAEERDLARLKLHTHLDEIVHALEVIGDDVTVEHLVLKHFSMRYPPAHVFAAVRAAIPARFADRVKILLSGPELDERAGARIDDV
ncbi:MAG: MBL fold metallo-hydrolase [Proteobacteria bacterium]|nr:MBL fold metallo-hydrolase [Pseudomonadota bacterium]